MANRSLFSASSANASPVLPAADTLNSAGGLAYSLPPKHALAQYALTGTFSTTFYATAETQLATTLQLCDRVADPKFIAQLAVYSREHGFIVGGPKIMAQAPR